MTKQNSISIIIPVFNEEKIIEDIIKEIKSVLSKIGYNYEIIAVDDGSTDSTAKILDNLKGIRVIHHPYNTGYGSALKSGILATKYNDIIMLDGDGTYPVKDIPMFLEQKDDFAMVSGARKGKNVNISMARRPAKFILSLLANFLTGISIPDINCGLRLIKKDNVTKFFNILPNRFSFTITHLLACLTNGYPVKFIPIDYYARKGKSTIHPINDFLKFGTIIFRVVVYFKPFKMFSFTSLFIFFAGLAYLLYGLYFLDKLFDVTFIITTLSAFQIFLFGILADMIAKNK